jgi:hypothetical protein
VEVAARAVQVTQNEVASLIREEAVMEGDLRQEEGEEATLDWLIPGEMTHSICFLKRGRI